MCSFVIVKVFILVPKSEGGDGRIAIKVNSSDMLESLAEQKAAISVWIGYRRGVLRPSGKIRI